MKELSPCVTAAVRALQKEVTGWEFARHLLEMHPEYAGNVPIAEIEREYSGEKKRTEEWLLLIEKRFPKETLLHTRVVLDGLFAVDPALKRWGQA